MDEMREGRTSRSSLPISASAEDFDELITPFVWMTDRVIHRISASLYAGARFNPGVRGNARFSPIKSTRGTAVPTIYGGSTFDCAAMETVFHDVPFAAGLKTYDKSKLAGQVYSQLVPVRPLVLADLGSTALRKLGIKRRQLIDTEKDLYPQTRAWAEAIHARRRDVEGLCWVSRQDDSAFALVLFGDRVSETDLTALGATVDITANGDVYFRLLSLADRIGVKIVYEGL
jgi:hypothetical protein